MFATRNRGLAAFLAALVAAALFSGLSACGGSSSERPKTEDRAKIDPSSFVDRITAAMQAKKTARLVLELGSSMNATAVVDYGASSGTAMSMKLETGPQTTNVVLAGGVMYLQQTKGQKFLKIDKSDPALGSLLEQVGDIGPQSAFARVKPGIRKIVDAGSATVGGEKLAHYVFTIDTSKVSSILGVGADQAKLPKTVTYDVYLDSEDLLRQLKFDINGQTLVMKASDWGKPVTITVPTGSQVMTR